MTCVQTRFFPRSDPDSNLEKKLLFRGRSCCSCSQYPNLAFLLIRFLLCVIFISMISLISSTFSSSKYCFITRALFPWVSMSQYLSGARRNLSQTLSRPPSLSHLFCCLSLSLAGMDLSINKTIRAHCLIHSFFISAILA